MQWLYKYILQLYSYMDTSLQYFADGAATQHEKLNMVQQKMYCSAIQGTVQDQSV